MEFIVLPTTYLLGVWLYGFMLRDVEPGSSRANTMVSMLVFSNENRKGEALL